MTRIERKPSRRETSSLSPSVPAALIGHDRIGRPTPDPIAHGFVGRPFARVSRLPHVPMSGAVGLRNSRLASRSPTAFLGALPLSMTMSPTTLILRIVANAGTAAI